VSGGVVRLAGRFGAPGGGVVRLTGNRAPGRMPWCGWPGTRGAAGPRKFWELSGSWEDPVYSSPLILPQARILPEKWPADGTGARL